MLARFLGALVLAGVLAGCAAEEVWAPDAVVSASTYRPEGPTSVTLLTMVSNTTGSGGHSALLIDGAERLLFDPAGSWHHPNVPERNDVLYGMVPTYFDYYMDYHARETYHVVVQELQVSPEQAALLSDAVQRYGAVPQAQCTRSISEVLRGTPGFESLPGTWFPNRLRQAFGQLPGVVETAVYDDDSDNNLELLQAQARAAISLEIAAEIAAD